MAELTGSEILAKSLKNEGTDILFFLMGGPMLLAESSCIKEGIRPLDVRHEQAAVHAAEGVDHPRQVEARGIARGLHGVMGREVRRVGVPVNNQVARRLAARSVADADAGRTLGPAEEGGEVKTSSVGGDARDESAGRSARIRSL